MAAEARRSVTRAYVIALLLAVVLSAATLAFALWSWIVVLTFRNPIETEGISLWAVPLLFIFELILLGWMLWRQAVILLRGRKSAPWNYIFFTAIFAYLAWGVIGSVSGFAIGESWLSPFNVALAVAWGVGSFVFWVILARRVYTDRPTPRWPWDKPGDHGPDWTIYGETPWEKPPRPGDEDTGENGGSDDHGGPDDSDDNGGGR